MSDATTEQPSYEEAREELIEVVRTLEAGGTTLEESLALWERGEALAKVCQQWLDGARKRLDDAMGTRGPTTDRIRWSRGTKSRHETPRRMLLLGCPDLDALVRLRSSVASLARSGRPHAAASCLGRDWASHRVSSPR